MRLAILYLLFLTTTAFGQDYAPKGCKFNVIKSDSVDMVEYMDMIDVKVIIQMRHSPNADDISTYGDIFVGNGINDFGIDNVILHNSYYGDKLEFVCDGANIKTFPSTIK